MEATSQYSHRGHSYAPEKSGAKCRGAEKLLSKDVPSGGVHAGGIRNTEIPEFGLRHGDSHAGNGAAL